MNTKFFIFYVGICLILMPSRVHGQQKTSSMVLPSASPETVEVSNDYLAAVDEYIESYVQQNKLPGGVFLIARKGKTIYHKGIGHWTPEKKQAYETEDIFRLASMTKAITTVAILQLYEQGKLGLDDPIKYYLPAFANPEILDTYNESDTTYTTTKAKMPICIRHLLTHTSGIVYGSFNPGKIKAIYEKLGLNEFGLYHTGKTTADMVNNLAKAPLMFESGTQYKYGLNMEVLGRIVEVVAQMSLGDYFQQHIFDPLGMKDTHFYLPESKHNRLVPVYTKNKEKGLHNVADTKAFAPSYPNNKPFNHFAGGGGLSSTAMDYAQFCQALLNEGVYNGKRILSRKTIEVMTADQMIALHATGKDYSKVPGLTYGLGFALRTEDARGYGHKSPGTFEWSGFFNTKFFIDPEEELVFVGLTQIVPNPHPEFWNRLYALLYRSLE